MYQCCQPSEGIASGAQIDLRSFLLKFKRCRLGGLVIPTTVLSFDKFLFCDIRQCSDDDWSSRPKTVASPTPLRRSLSGKASTA